MPENATGGAGQSQRRSERRSGLERRSGRDGGAAGRWEGANERRTGERRAFDRRSDNRPALLTGFSPEDLRSVLEHFELRGFRPREYVVRADTHDSSLYLIKSGRFEVLVPAGGQHQSAGYLRQGDVFGELSFFDHEPRSADIRAVDSAEVLVLNSEGFGRLRDQQPQLAVDLVMRIAAVSSGRFRAHNRKLASLGMIAAPPIW